MARFRFFRFEDCEDGKMAVLESVDENYPVNILDRKSTRLNSSHPTTSRMPSSA